MTKAAKTMRDVLDRKAALALACMMLISPAQASRVPQAPESTRAVLETAESFEGNYLAAVIAGASRDTSGATHYFREALKGDPRNMELLERAFVVFLADGAMTDAFQAAERLIRQDGSNGLAQLALGVRALQSKQFAIARKHLVKGGRGRSADLTATLLSAWASVGSNNTKRAFETVDRLNGEKAYAIFRDYHAGLMAEVLNQPTQAERRLRAAYEADRNTLRVVDAFARLQARRGNKEAALKAYQDFEQVLPRHPLIMDAVERLKADKPLEPLAPDAIAGAAEALYGLGSAGSRQGDELAAMIYLQLALFLNPKHDMALVTLGDLVERSKQVERAVELYRQIPESSPLRPNADIQIGLGLETLGRSDEAIKHLEALVTRHPEDLEAMTALGNVLRVRKKFAEAAQVYTKAIDLVKTPDRTHWNLFYFRGIAYERSKEWPKAEADLNKSLELVPEQAGSEKALILNYLGYSWVDQGIHLEKAFEMLKQAVELRPRDGYIVDSLGWAYYRKGRYDEAVRELERAIELKPGDPVINDHLGDAYWKVGRTQEAKFQWRHAKDANPEPEDLEKIVKKLERGLEDDTASVPKSAEPPKDGG